MGKEYVEERNGGYYVAGTRVSLDSIVYGFCEGLSPEAILEDFDVLTLEQVYGPLPTISPTSPPLMPILCGRNKAACQQLHATRVK